MYATCRLLLILLLAAAAPQTVNAEAADAVWDRVRTGLFPGRPIAEDMGKVIALETPLRAEDASTVPIAIHVSLPEGAERSVKKIYLVIDKNPSPLGAVFSFFPDSGRADIETRVRIEEYSFVRAIAELSDGSLHMASNYVKAAGGCSAPAGKDQAAALARLGKMKLRIDQAITPERPVQAQLMVSHPNNSGLVMDQMTRLYEPSNFVRHIEVSYAGKPVLSADVDFTISENPNFRFYFVPRGDGALKAEVVDSHELKFETSLAIRPEGGLAY